MTFRKHLFTVTLSALVVSSSLPAHAGILGGKKKKEEAPARKLTAAQSALIDKAIVREAEETVKVIKERTPLVETYIQNMRPAARRRAGARVGRAAPHPRRLRQAHQRRRATQRKNPMSRRRLTTRSAESSSTRLASLQAAGRASLHLQFHEAGFVRMLVMDDESSTARPTTSATSATSSSAPFPPLSLMSPRSPKQEHHPGQQRSSPASSFGRIWIETHNGNVVRFDGNVSGYREGLQGVLPLR
jgi:hypothetical protein